LLQEDLGLFHYVEKEMDKWKNNVSDGVVMEYLLSKLFDNQMPTEEFSMADLDNVLHVLHFPFKTSDLTLGDGNCFFRLIKWSNQSVCDQRSNFGRPLF
jgi:hypothetical protein